MKVKADLPLDHPTLRGPFRVYFALTNHCNRSCPWCCACSSPAGRTFLSVADFVAGFPRTGDFEVQLEGGEPTLHPEFDALVAIARADAKCTRLVLSTNGVTLPRQRTALAAFLDQLGDRCTVKLSVNHHLLEHDPGLLELAAMIRDLFQGTGRELILNVRLRPDAPDAWVEEAVRAAGLAARANVFLLQRFGFARDENGWEPPFLAGTKFDLVNPDGRHFGTDLIGRAEALLELEG